MDNPLIFSDDRYGKFNYHKDISHESIKGLDLSKKTINRILRTAKFTPIDDSVFAYKYYLSRFYHNVKRWYRSNHFQILQCDQFPFSTKFLFVKNMDTGRHLDDVISKVLFDEITDRIKSNCAVYTVQDHAIDRAKQRIPELEGKTDSKIYSWLLSRSDTFKECTINENKYKVAALLNHNFETCKYYMDLNNRVYVVKDHMIATIHCNEAERWSLK